MALLLPRGRTLGTAILAGLKSGATANFTTAGPNRFCCGVGEATVTVCTAAGSMIAMFASFGAQFTLRSCAAPASEASRSTYQTRLPCASPR